MKTTSRILLLLGSEEENDTQIALGLGLRLAKVQPVELYSDQASFAPPNRRLYCHRCTHWNLPPLQPVALIDLKGQAGARQLARWADPLQKRNYEFYVLVHPFSPPAITPQETAKLLRQAEQHIGLQITGLIHCPTFRFPLSASLDFMGDCTLQSGKPVVLHAASSPLLQQFSKMQRRYFHCLSLGKQTTSIPENQKEQYPNSKAP